MRKLQGASRLFMNQYDVQLFCRSIEGHLWDIVAVVLVFKVKTPMFKTPNKRLGNDPNTCGANACLGVTSQNWSSWALGGVVLVVIYCISYRVNQTCK